ncbi:hypothetical protein PG996_006784 [Apiospora saccharicola]|uniref:Uncharacterized protein n=1 Tax=Apiospora saccharicola TaxID=335842 RepID=A0ABR1V9V7_9PEZI
MWSTGVDIAAKGQSVDPLQVSVHLLSQCLDGLNNRLPELHLQSSQGLLGGIGLTGILQAGDARGEDVVEVDEGLQDGLGQALEILAVGEVLAAARRAVSDGFESSPETEAERLLGLPFFAPGGGIAVLLGDLYGLGHGGEDNADGLKDVHFGKRAQSVTKRLQGVEHQSF